MVKQKVHVGCGKRNFGEGWLHVDGAKEFDHVKYHDVFLKQFADESVSLIYAAHLIEYFDRVEVMELLAQWHRVLKPGGVLRLAVPDFLKLKWVYENGAGNLDSILGPLFGKMELNGQKVYHKTVYDFKSLRRVLEAARFKYVRLYDWRETEHAEFDDHSQAYIPHMDKNGLLISLNVEAIKRMSYEL